MTNTVLSVAGHSILRLTGAMPIALGGRACDRFRRVCEANRGAIRARIRRLRALATGRWWWVPPETSGARCCRPSPTSFPCGAARWNSPQPARACVRQDDEPSVLKGLRLVIEDWGYTVLTACTELEAISILNGRKQALDIIIADCRLRGICNGAQMVAHIRQTFGWSVLCILITGDTAPERIREANNHGSTLLKAGRTCRAARRDRRKPVPAGDGRLSAADRCSCSHPTRSWRVNYRAALPPRVIHASRSLAKAECDTRKALEIAAKNSEGFDPGVG
jgi:CheY-like chemotaxis protein